MTVPPFSARGGCARSRAATCQRLIDSPGTAPAQSSGDLPVPAPARGRGAAGPAGGRRRLRSGPDPARRRVRLLRAGRAVHAHRRDADLRHRPARLPAVVPRRRPGIGQGLRERGRVRDRRRARLPARQGHVGAGAVQRRDPARPEDLRRQPDGVLDHRRAQAGRRLLLAVLRRQTGGGRTQGHAGRGRDEHLPAQEPQGGGPGRYDQPGRGDQADRPRRRACGVQHQRRRQARADQRADRRAGRRPAHGLLHHLGRAGQRHDRRTAPAARRIHARAVRRGAGQGQCAHRLRVPGRGQAPVGGHAHPAGDAVAVGGRVGARAEVTAGAASSPLARERAAYRRSRARRSTLVAVVSTVVFAGALVLVVTSSPGWPRVQTTFFDPATAWKSLPAVLAGLWLNVRVLVAAEIGILVLGLLIAVLRTLRGPVFFPVRALAIGYVDLFRGVPLIIALYLIGFGVPGLRLQGVPTDAAVLGTITLVLVYSAYVSEVFRAGIESVHPSQRMAARSLGLTHRQAMRLVVLPQAVRRVLPPLLNDFVALQKDCG